VTSCTCNTRIHSHHTRRKATGSLKIVHEKYGEKMKSNHDETEAYYNEFRTAKAVNEAMEGHIQKVCSCCWRVISALLWRRCTVASNMELQLAAGRVLSALSWRLCTMALDRSCKYATYTQW
jgi:hypothetical protein